jgi:hypothetical protein
MFLFMSKMYYDKKFKINKITKTHLIVFYIMMKFKSGVNLLKIFLLSMVNINTDYKTNLFLR